MMTRRLEYACTKIKKKASQNSLEPAFILYVKLLFRPQDLALLKQRIFSELAQNINYKTGIDSIKLSVAKNSKKKNAIKLSKNLQKKNP